MQIRIHELITFLESFNEQIFMEVSHIIQQLLIDKDEMLQAIGQQKLIIEEQQQQLTEFTNFRNAILDENQQYIKEAEHQHAVNKILTERIDSLTKTDQQITQLETQFKIMQQQLSAIEQENIFLKQDSQRIQQNNIQLLKIIDQLELELQKMKGQILSQDCLNSEIQNLKFQIQQQQISIQNLEQDNISVNQEVERLHSHHHSYIQRIEEAQEELHISVDEVQTGLDAELETLQPIVETPAQDIHQYDFAGISNNSILKSILKEGEEQTYLSDSIFRINIGGQKHKRILYLTTINIYLFEETNNDLKLNKQIPIIRLTQLILSQSSNLVICFKLEQSDDYLFETFKRNKIIEFIKDIKLDIKIEVQQNFLVNFKGYNPKYLSEIFSNLNSKNSAFKQGAQQGILQYHQKRMFGYSVTEVFGLLTDQGLLILKEHSDIQPLLFIPYSESIIVRNPLNIKGYAFKLKYNNSEFIFSTNSQMLLDEWHQLISDHIVSQYKMQIALQQI